MCRPRSGLPRHPGVTGRGPPPIRPTQGTRPSEIEGSNSPTHESSDIAMTSTESRRLYADHGQIQPANTLRRADKVIPSRERLSPRSSPPRVRSAARVSLLQEPPTSARRSPAARPASSISVMAVSSSVLVWACEISPDWIITSSVSSMPFLVAIHSPNRSVHLRSAAAGVSSASSSWAPVTRDLIEVYGLDQRLAGGKMPVERRDGHAGAQD